MTLLYLLLGINLLPKKKMKPPIYFSKVKPDTFSLESLKTQQNVEWDSCKSQFNDEFNFPIDSDLPVPMSIFHRQSKLYLIFSTETYLADPDYPEWKRNFSSPVISNVKKWFGKDVWKIQFQLNGSITSVICQAIPTPFNLIIIVTCPLGNMQLSYVFPDSIADSRFY